MGGIRLNHIEKMNMMDEVKVCMDKSKECKIYDDEQGYLAYLNMAKIKCDYLMEKEK